MVALQKLGFETDERSVRTAFAAALCGALDCPQPLPYAHIFAPVLPRGSTEVLEAPVPFAVGVGEGDVAAWAEGVRRCGTPLH